ncbi:hypothetical protein BDW22DRAFT_1429388 [Trametopsis cervina]|nr:hypothetical protein BDW22DRAFT_1429388 [Trametopsis cervina]
MSLSTTSTATYVLTKYSRAYPSPANANEADVEWQHFTNPIIRLVLDIKKAADGELDSYRVRVLWSLSTGIEPDAMDIDQPEVVFEDVDLLAFSPQQTQSESQAHNFALHGLPLKAVHCESVVGMRYMHPRVISHDATPSYRRFQVNFQQTSDAASFIDAIRHVCPCKSNAPGPGPGLAARSMPMTSASVTSGSNAMQPPKLPMSAVKRPMRPSITMQVPTLPRRAPASRLPPAPSMLRSLASSEQPAVPHGAHSQIISSSGVPNMNHSANTTTVQPASRQSHLSSTAVTPLLSRSQTLATASGTAAVQDLRSTQPLHQPFSAPSQLNYSYSDIFDSGGGNYPESQVPTHSTDMNVHLTPGLASSGLEQSAVVPAVELSDHDTGSLASSGSSHAASYSASLVASSNPVARDPQQAAQPAVAAPSSTQASSVPSSPAGHSSNMLSGSRPSSGLVGLTADAISAGPEPAKDIIAALQEETALYKLPRKELEFLVASIVREEGFAQLLESLDSLWKVKAFVGIQP